MFKSSASLRKIAACAATFILGGGLAASNPAMGEDAVWYRAKGTLWATPVFTPDGKWMVGGGFRDMNLPLNKATGIVCVWNAQTQKLMTTLTPYNVSPAVNMALSRDGQWLVVIGMQDTRRICRVWGVNTNAKLPTDLLNEAASYEHDYDQASVITGHNGSGWGHIMVAFTGSQSRLPTWSSRPLRELPIPRTTKCDRRLKSGRCPAELRHRAPG